ncbi:GNAT family N-acetyltransferase [Clostridium estertheticum]|uniref:GNAT family N-acetyltransferase n=1 Tax=Clostridium estertheticum TaxID=238834 RepID=UPI001C6F30DC|nr:GNAT family N-acetyltransferase [Clostridium estertheticum]MBW9153936.1 GNAT family N-acetyltransferase [Clostridium estertheticum]WLC85576.1 GNAT family N-acetyltransferase [Clostridium estertheticum]
MYLELIKFSNEYIKLIEKWENTNELSKYLSHTRPEYLRKLNIELEKHTLFFMIKFDEQIIGSTWMENITENDATIGIYIAIPNYRGKGIGSEVIKSLIDRAFKEINLNKLYLNVREKNINAIKCYKKLGFKITKEYPKAYFMDSSYQGKYQMTLINDKITKFIGGSECVVVKEHSNVCFVHGGYGSPAIADTVETLIALDVKDITLIGMCGGFSKKVKVGDVIIPRKVLSEEGTSLHYYENIKFVEQSEILISKGLSYFNQYFNKYQLNTVTNWGNDVSQLVIDKQYEHDLIWKSI